MQKNELYLYKNNGIDFRIVAVALDELNPDLSCTDLTLFALVEDCVPFYGELNVLIMSHSSSNLKTGVKRDISKWYKSYVPTLPSQRCQDPS